MNEPTPNYRREFLRSPHHVALGILTLGLGFASGMLLPLILGATAYVLGLLHIPDMDFFRRWVDRRRAAEREAAAMAQVDGFVKRRDLLLSTLSTSRRGRYETLAGVCRDIESASADNPITATDAAADPRLRKLDELMWTYLRLLGIEESLERFLETERREDLPHLVSSAEEEVQRITQEMEG
ncbi:MAG TPA: hypothetical protein VMZ27_01310, partial [Candidatus Saccharimonadales bacterium]|nr:hypothetical protein [Candidatus Saccharimonadales bacterium]